MSDEQSAPSKPVNVLIRIYLLFATMGGILSVPVLGLLGWFAWEWTKEEWPGNWGGWAIYGMVCLVLVLGPLAGRVLFKRGRPFLALAVSAGSMVLPALVIIGFSIK